LRSNANSITRRSDSGDTTRLFPRDWGVEKLHEDPKVWTRDQRWKK